MTDPFSDSEYGADMGIGLDTGPTPEQLAEVVRLANEQRALEQWIERAEALMKERKEMLRVLAQVKVPQAMLDAGMRNFTLESGHKVEVDNMVVGNITKEARDRFYDWCEANGHGSIVKKLVSVAFGKGESDDADNLFHQLKDEFPNRPVVNDRTIHAQTLAKFIREMHAKGESLPPEVTITELQVAKITPPKGDLL